MSFFYHPDVTSNCPPSSTLLNQQTTGKEVEFSQHSSMVKLGIVDPIKKSKSYCMNMKDTQQGMDDNIENYNCNIRNEEKSVQQHTKKRKFPDDSAFQGKLTHLDSKLNQSGDWIPSSKSKANSTRKEKKQKGVAWWLQNLLPMYNADNNKRRERYEPIKHFHSEPLEQDIEQSDQSFSSTDKDCFISIAGNYDMENFPRESLKMPEVEGDEEIRSTGTLIDDEEDRLYKLNKENVTVNDGNIQDILLAQKQLPENESINLIQGKLAYCCNKVCNKFNDSSQSTLSISGPISSSSSPSKYSNTLVLASKETNRTEENSSKEQESVLLNVCVQFQYGSPRYNFDVAVEGEGFRVKSIYLLLADLSSPFKVDDLILKIQDKNVFDEFDGNANLFSKYINDQIDGKKIFTVRRQVSRTQSCKEDEHVTLRENGFSSPIENILARCSIVPHEIRSPPYVNAELEALFPEKYPSQNFERSGPTCRKMPLNEEKRDLFEIDLRNLSLDEEHLIEKRELINKLIRRIRDAKSKGNKSKLLKELEKEEYKLSFLELFNVRKVDEDQRIVDSDWEEEEDEMAIHFIEEGDDDSITKAKSYVNIDSDEEKSPEFHKSSSHKNVPKLEYPIISDLYNGGFDKVSEGVRIPMEDCVQTQEEQMFERTNKTVTKDENNKYTSSDEVAKENYQMNMQVLHHQINNSKFHDVSSNFSGRENFHTNPKVDMTTQTDHTWIDLCSSEENVIEIEVLDETKEDKDILQMQMDPLKERSDYISQLLEGGENSHTPMKRKDNNNTESSRKLSKEERNRIQSKIVTLQQILKESEEVIIHSQTDSTNSEYESEKMEDNNSEASSEEDWETNHYFQVGDLAWAPLKDIFVPVNVVEVRGAEEGNSLVTVKYFFGASGSWAFQAESLYSWEKNFLSALANPLRVDDRKRIAKFTINHLISSRTTIRHFLPRIGLDPNEPNFDEEDLQNFQKLMDLADIQVDIAAMMKAKRKS